MKNVLFIGMTPNQGGLETFMMNIFSKLEGHGYHFEFVNAYNKPIAYEKYIQSHGGVIRHVKINRSHIGLLTRYYCAKHFFRYHHNYDIVHLNTLSLNNIYWLKAANKFDIPKLIIHSHDCNFIHSSKIVEMLSQILSIWNRHFLNNSRVNELAVSESAGKWMFHNNNFLVIKNGIDVYSYRYNRNLRIRLRHKLHIKLNFDVYITVARLTPQKNYNKILHIFYYIHKSNNRSKLVIVGNGYEKFKIKHLVQNLRLGSSVIFLGAINDVNNVLNIADLMIMPSKYEGFPFALIESQAAGVPAIVSSKAIPTTSNVTGTLKYISLNESSFQWARMAILMAHKYNDVSEKYNMNRIVMKSPYNISFLIKQINNVYSQK